MIFEHIVDTTASLVFEIETNFAQSSLSIARHRRLQQQRASHELAYSSQNFSPMHYINTQYLADSSLSQDALRLSSAADAVADDGAAAAAAESPLASTLESSAPMAGSAADGNTNAANDAQPDYIVIELDALNSNACIDSVVCAIEHIYKIFLNTLPPPAGAPMPNFMHMLYERMRSPVTHLNIRWFILKV